MAIHYKQHRSLFLILGVGLLIGLFWLARAASLQALIINKHRVGGDKLLTYVTDLRRELADYRFLPYTLTDNPNVRHFLHAPYHNTSSEYKALQRQLADITKVSQTRDWFILDAQGNTLISSEQANTDAIADYFEPSTIKQQLILQKGESILLSSYHKTADKVTHLVLAPVYENNQVAGAIAVRIGLNHLIDSWTVAGDLMSITDKSNQVFLANGLGSLFQPGWKADTRPINLIDQTHAEIYHQNGQSYLLQSVILDDLLWQLHYLSPLKQIYKTANFIALAGIILVALIVTFLLYRRERSLKIASKVENQRLISQSTQLQRALIDNTHVGLIQLTRNGIVSFINPTGYRYFGGQDDIIGHSLLQLLPLNTMNQAVRQLLTDLVYAQTPTHFIEQEVLLAPLDKSAFPALLSVSPIEWSDSSGYLVTIIDISKRKRAELALTLINQQLEARVLARTKDLEAAQKELLRSEKLAAIGQMSTAIAHELNQPLTGIRTLVYTTELLLQRNNIEEAHASLVNLETLIGRMHTLTSELKVLAYRRPESLVNTDLQQCLTSAIDGLGDKLANATVNMDLQANWVMAEPTRLERIFSNLISNSLEACAEIQQAAHIHISSTSQDDELVIQVTDNGPGVSDEALAHLLEPFYTSKPIGKGLGLGLAISANLANDMQGALTVAKSNNSGLQFRLTLKRAQSDDSNT